MIKTPFTLEYLYNILHYDPETGDWTWKVSRGSVKAGQKTGCNSHGYLVTRINKACYPCHVLAWYYMTGEWPEKDIDHENTIKNDNRWKNLRLATVAQNGANRGPNRNNTTGYKGVYWREDIKRYTVKIQKNRKQHSFGCYDDIIEAAKTYDRKAIELHGEYAKLNFPTSF